MSNPPSSQNSIEWQYANESMNLSLPNSSIPVYHANNNPQISMPELYYNRSDMESFMPIHVDIVPSTLPHLPTDSSFIERAAKFSSFSTGNFTALLNPLSTSLSIDHVHRCQSLSRNGKNNDLAHIPGDSKKRKSCSQDMELEQVTQFSGEVIKENVVSKQNNECSSSAPNATDEKKCNGKNKKSSVDDEPKKDYIHVRARRGQATNSHSLAERVRRERISERMKYLQDLVPGCNKVTGKAVMLDEIINYVQSLQRQVEFLSMKLATVNPNMDLSIEGLLSKDPRFGLSTVGFNAELLQPQHGMLQMGVSGMADHADSLRRIISSQYSARNGLKEPQHPMLNQWETELQSMVQTNIRTSLPPNTSQGQNGKPHDSFPL